MRDSERSKTYDAENEVLSILLGQGTVEMFGSRFAIPDERKFSDIAGVQRYVDAVMDHIGQPKSITVRERKGQTKAHYEPLKQVIAVPVGARWALREMVILHEIAHHITPSDLPSHGREFRRNFSELAGKVLAPEAEFFLRVAFGERGLTI